jgi:hypothetical protein
VNWDWYSATLESSADHVLGVLQGGQDLTSVYPCRGLHSYSHGAEVRRGDRIFARAFWGGVNGDDVHVQASGSDTPAVVETIRQHWPEHRVSRADSREDWTHPKAWRWVSKIAIGVAEELGVRTNTVGDWIQAEHGRTLYLGGKTSRVQVRVYEKGKQLGVDPNWVRLEVQVRPTGIGKSALCSALPGQLMQTSIWTQVLSHRVGMPELDAVRIRDPWTPSDDENALRWCIQQYGAVLGRKAQSLGGWAELGSEIGRQVEAGETLQ